MIRRLCFLLLSIIALLVSCNSQTNDVSSLTNYVNPFIGTGGHGHTYPGASAPYGMMQLSPDTRLDGWDGCSGYHYSDEIIYGFSHTHLSGTGVSDYGDILLMPTNRPILNNGADGNPGYRSQFNHKKEQASPGFYQVHLEDTNIDVALTVSQRSGMHQYNYPTANNQFLILDLEHRDKLLDHELTVISPTVITGKRFSSAWAKKQMLFFYIETSHPIKNWNQQRDKTTSKRAIEFDNPKNQTVYIKIGISAVDVEGAKNNLEAEIGEQTFTQTKEKVRSSWEYELSKITVSDENRDQLEIFYTALYHTMLAPNLYQDVDGRYRGMDLEIHQTNDFDYYTVFSLWDTYRAAHPLYTIIDEKRTNDYINTFLAKYDEGGIMPIWDLSGNYTGCMIGYHAVPVIADAYLKGIRGYDATKALDAMKNSAIQDHLGLASYKSYGFIPVEVESESVSKTLEYAYDDWAIAQMALAMNQKEDFESYIQRAQNFKNLYNPATGFFQGRYHNTWFAPFDPYEVNFNYTEANAWQYSLYAPQDITGHINLVGGNAAYEKHLDRLFTTTPQTSGRNQADITGLIGQYAHGNEPSHHMAYLYNFVGKPYKTQERVYEILTSIYTNQPDGISGNEDCGQMSAWYVLSAMGFYPVTPASGDYIIGTPIFDKVTISLEDDQQLIISRTGEGKYIENLAINGKEYSKSYVTHQMILEGGAWEFTMSQEPQTWGSNVEERPKTGIDSQTIISAPFLKDGSISFADSTTVNIASLDKDASIFYRINGNEFKKYKGPFTVNSSSLLETYAANDQVKSAIIPTQFYKYDNSRSITLDYEYASEYSAGGNDALINGMRGTRDYRSGAWQGIKNQNLDATVNLGASTTINEVRVNFLKDQRSWIFYPTTLQVELMDAQKNAVATKRIALPKTGKEELSEIYQGIISFDNKKALYIRVTATNYGKLPPWHLGYSMEGTSWIFVDEISIE